MKHDFVSGERVCLKWQVNVNRGLDHADPPRRGTVFNLTGRTSVEVAVRMDDTGRVLKLHHTMWRKLDLIEIVGEMAS